MWVGFWRESAQQKALERKLLELRNMQQSVQPLNLWLIHHHKDLGLIVSVWEQELQKLKVMKIHCFADVK
uniref:CID domain-containing protein n=1 Tax=Phasianus colchicus TaxID=9054 RepID=A0A669R447_PHACC